MIKIDMRTSIIILFFLLASCQNNDFQNLPTPEMISTQQLIPQSQSTFLKTKERESTTVSSCLDNESSRKLLYYQPFNQEGEFSYFEILENGYVYTEAEQNCLPSDMVSRIYWRINSRGLRSVYLSKQCCVTPIPNQISKYQGALYIYDSVQNDYLELLFPLDLNDGNHVDQSIILDLTLLLP